jgi:hypothetical protein
MSKGSIGGAIAVAVLAAGSIAGAQGRVTASATGSGHVIVNDTLRTFSFTVQRDAAGNAKGQVEIYNRDQGIRSHGTLNCLNVSGNTAIISGQLTDSTSSDWEGAYVWLKVVDNGEGGKAPPDKLTLVYAVTPDFTCDLDASVPYMDVQKGNIQIRP